MPLSNNIAHYEDIRPYLDRALNAESGLRITLASHGQAVNLRQRLYKLRQLERIANLEVYPIGDERRGTSSWDHLIIDVSGKGEKNDNILTIIPGVRVKVEEI